MSLDTDVQVLDHTRGLAELLAPCGEAGLVLTTDANLVSHSHQLGCCRYSCKCMINAGFAVLRGDANWLTEQHLDERDECAGQHVRRRPLMHHDGRLGAPKSDKPALVER